MSDSSFPRKVATANATASVSLPSVASRLELLFSHVYPAGGHPYSQARAAELASTMGHTVTVQQIQGIVSRRTKYPSFDTIAALAEFFNVPLEYFATTNPDTWHSYERWIKLMRERSDSTEHYAPRLARWRQIREDRLARRRDKDAAS